MVGIEIVWPFLVQSLCCFDSAWPVFLAVDLVSLNLMRRGLENQDGQSPLGDNDSLVDVLQIINVLIAAFEKAEHRNSINLPQCVDLTLNWLLNVFDR